MTTTATEDPILFSLEADGLLVLCEEVTRATPEGAKRFIEPAPGVLARAKSRQHNIIFGRRGSGKSSLLRKAAADLTVDRRPIAFVDMETFKGHSYPDVLISVLIKSLLEFKKWLESAATTPSTKKSFWKRLFGTAPTRPPFNKEATEKILGDLSTTIAGLEEQLRLPESASKQTKATLNQQNGSAIDGGFALKNSPVELSGKASRTRQTNEGIEEQSTYVSYKVEYLHQNILEFQRFFNTLSEISSGPAFLILDDLYHIRKADQAKVIDYFHRIAKTNNLWLKIGTIKHRSQWYEHSDPPIGIKLGDDAKEINLDLSLEKYEILREFLTKILSNLILEKPPLVMKELIIPTAIDRLTIASGGVVRDFIGIFSNALLQARNRGRNHHRGPRIGTEDVNLAAGEYDSHKREEFKLDTAEDRQKLEDDFGVIVQFCTTKAKSSVFLVSQKMVGPIRNSIDQLIDLRLIHPVKSRVTLKRGAEGELFEAYMLDLSQYTAARKVHDFQIIDLSAGNRDELIRKASLKFPGV